MRDPSDDLLKAVQQSSLPSMLVRVPSEQILAASQEVGRLLGRPVADLVGGNVEDFTEDEPSGALPLVATGRLSGFQARRHFRRADGEPQPLQAWIRAADADVPVSFVIVILWPGGRSAWSYLPSGAEPDEDSPVIVGTVNSRMELERVSEDVEVLGMSAGEAVGASVFRLFDVTSAADVLQALAEATDADRAVCISVNVHVKGEQAMAELLLRPLLPGPSFSFSLCIGKGEEAGRPPTDQSGLERMGRGLHGLALADALTFLHGAHLPGVDKLTSRELDITARLLTGDRVPAIAGAVYLSQSTVRNHLSRVFHKLGVRSQQELIERFREKTDRLAGDDTSST